MKTGEGVRDRFMGAGRVKSRQVEGSWTRGVMGRVKVGNIMVGRVVSFPQDREDCLSGRMSGRVTE